MGPEIGSGEGRLILRDTEVDITSARGSDGSQADLPKTIVVEQFGFAPNGASFQEVGNPWLIENTDVIVFVRPSDTSPSKYIVATAAGFVEVTQRGVQPASVESSWMNPGVWSDAAGVRRERPSGSAS